MNFTKIIKKFINRRFYTEIWHVGVFKGDITEILSNDFLENKNTFLMFIEFHPHVDREKHVEVLKKLESLGFVCLDATKEYISNDKGKDSGIVKRLHKPDAMINDLYSDSFYTQSGGCEVFLGKGINKQ